MSEPQRSPLHQIARAAGTVMSAYVLVQIAGLVRGILIYRAFGTSSELDSFNAANRVAELLFNLMAGGALGSAFIPTFTGLLAKENRQRAWQLASAIASLLFLVLSAISLLVFLFAPQVVRHGLFILSPERSIGQESLTIALLRLLLPTVVIFGLSGLVMGILNAHQRFWLPALAPAMYSLGQIGGVLFLPASMGIYRLAVGALIGSLLHLLIQFPDLLKLGGGFTPMLGVDMPEVREVGKLMAPRVLGAAVVQINFIVNTILALSLAEGSVSAVTLAFTWMLMPQAIIAQSVAIAALPTFSAQAALGKFDELRSALAGALRGVLFLSLPAAVGLILIRTPLIRFLYEGGSFTSQSTEMVTWALLWYAVGLPAHCLLEVIVRAFYALHDTRTPVGVGVVAMGLNIALSFLFTALFARIGWMPHGGLALANSLATLLEMLTLLVLLRKRLNGLEGRRVLGSLFSAGAGTLALASAITLLLNLSSLSDLLQIGASAVLGIAVYGVVLVLLRVPEVEALRRLALRIKPLTGKG